MTITIYHNPDCGTSRNTLAMIRQSGEEPLLIEYLKAPPARADIVRMIADAGLAAAITGFEPVDIVEGIWLILQQIENRQTDVAIQYSRGVRPEGNVRAMALLESVFEITDASWRGLGVIPQSGLAMRAEFAAFDALKKFAIPDIHSQDIPGCGCGDILRGIKLPHDCPLFRKVCTPVNPVGPCMVSSEGTCSAYYKYY